MKNILAYSLTAITLFIHAATIQAEDGSGNFAIWGKGSKSCYHYTQASTDAVKRAEYEQYLYGFVTSFNKFTPGTHNIANNMRAADIVNWVNEYCQANPMLAFERALEEFIFQRLENRQ